MPAKFGIPANQLIAHRGYQRYYPENSPLAIEKAIACGALFVEIDVQFSADGVPLLYHDDDLKRVSGTKGKLSQHPFSTLKTLSAGEPGRFKQQFSSVKIAPLSALVDILRSNPAVNILVELKEEAVRDYTATFCLTRIHETLESVIDQCILISFDIDALRAAKKTGFKRLAPVLRDWTLRHTIKKELEAELVICNYKRIPEKDSLLMENCCVAVYEVDSIPLAQSLLDRGARFIETFAIGEMLGNHART
ncbi:MAG TPA: glycerophosphodiester phosphodiesterase family protein [Pseudomonadales bacterium]|nr:glycerophosphodiester phosphodiesterase family protein [Pseudomonadales bacterium]